MVFYPFSVRICKHLLSWVGCLDDSRVFCDPAVPTTARLAEASERRTGGWLCALASKKKRLTPTINTIHHHQHKEENTKYFQVTRIWGLAPTQGKKTNLPVVEKRRESEEPEEKMGKEKVEHPATMVGHEGLRRWEEPCDSHRFPLWLRKRRVFHGVCLTWPDLTWLKLFLALSYPTWFVWNEKLFRSGVFYVIWIWNDQEVTNSKRRVQQSRERQIRWEKRNSGKEVKYRGGR